MTQGPAKRGTPIGGPEDLFKMLNAAGLKERIFFTLGMIALYRIGVHIPLPGVDPGAMMRHQELAQSLLGMIDLFTGGALNKLSIFSMGIGPYITASIIMQLMAVVFPKLEDLQKNSGEAGRKQLAQYTRYATVGLAFFQSFMLARLLMSIRDASGMTDVVPYAGPALLFGIPAFVWVATLIMTASAMFVMWIGELITVYGVGNGASLLIFLGIASRLPVMIRNTWESVHEGQTSAPGAVSLLIIFLGLTALVVCLQQGVRKILVLGRKNVGRQMLSMPEDYLYLPVNPSGVMAIIFASSLMMFPTTVMQFLAKGGNPGQGLQDLLAKAPGIGPGWVSFTSLQWVKDGWEFVVQEFYNSMSYSHWEHSLFYFMLIIFFAFFYSSIILQPKDMAENLRRSGRAIQGVKPGRPTGEYLEKVLARLTAIGATAIGIVAILPIHAEQLTGVQTLQGLGSTSLIILVGVAIDTQRQIVTHALSAKYQARGLFNKGSGTGPSAETGPETGEDKEQA
jgi:preprotein translocase subunit SecY